MPPEVEYIKYVDTRFSDVMKGVDQRFNDAKEAVLTASASFEKRMDGVNEFREQLKDQAATLASTDHVNAQLKGMEDRFMGEIRTIHVRVDEFRDWKNKQEGAANSSRRTSIVAIVISAILMLFVALNFFGYGHQTDPVRQQQTTNTK